MTALKIALGVLYLVICAVLVIIVLLQEPKQEGMSVITGQAESFFGKNKGKTKEAFLGKLTILFSIVFAVVAILLGALTHFIV